MLDSNGCIWTLDPKYDTNIVITLSDIKIDNVSSRKYTWTIPYKSLIDSSPPVTPQYAAPTEFTLDRAMPSVKPPFPMPSFILSAGTDSNVYWEEFAKFVWSQITLGNYYEHKTAYTFVPSRTHEFPDHPEKPGRLDVLEPLLNSFDAEQIETRAASFEQVARVHQPQLIKAIEEVCKEGPGIIDHAPTYITQTSYQDALLAAGGVIECTRAVINGDAKNAFAIVRPPTSRRARPRHGILHL